MAPTFFRSKELESISMSIGLKLDSNKPKSHQHHRQHQDQTKSYLQYVGPRGGDVAMAGGFKYASFRLG
jgi:hypothetical protein